MSGKSPTCEADVLDALTASLEPRFRAASVLRSKDAAVKFLLKQRILVKGYESTVTCDRCAEGCEVPVIAHGEQRVYVCPTGYIERPVVVSDEDVTCYRFDLAALRAGFSAENGLRALTDTRSLPCAFHPVGTGRKAGRRVTAVYAQCLDGDGTVVTLEALKGRIGCDRLWVLLPHGDGGNKSLSDALGVRDISIVSLADLFARRTLALDGAVEDQGVPPEDAYCRVFAHTGSDFMRRDEYEALCKKKTDYDMFIDGFHKRAWRRTAAGKTSEAILTATEFRIIAGYIKLGKPARPTKFDSSAKVFETARRKVDVPVSRYTWRAFTTHRNPTAQRMNEFQFTPPDDLKYCLVSPLT